MWKDFSQIGGDTSGTGIKAQVFNGDGSLFGTEFLVNTSTNGTQFTPQIATLADGRFVVTWTDGGPNAVDLSGDAVRGQIFDARTAAISVIGSSGADRYLGTAFGDTLSGDAGNDTLQGEGGRDRLLGQSGNDVLTGGAGGDFLFGGAGRDHLDGGAGPDRMTGGGGGDTFVFAPLGGTDRITDFGNGNDRIDLAAYGFASVAAATAQFADDGADCVFTFGSDVLTIANFSLGQLTGADLIL